jgi:hypothetical protein
MAHKTKLVDAPASTLSAEAKLEKALELLYSGKAEAGPAFEALAKEAAEIGRFGLARTAMNYRKAIERRSAPDAEVAMEVELEVSVLVNQKAWESALTVINGAISGGSTKGLLHYLKALVLAQTGCEEESAASMKTAVSLDRSMLFLYKLEPDFNLVRRHRAFVEFETA